LEYLEGRRQQVQYRRGKGQHPHNGRRRGTKTGTKNKGCNRPCSKKDKNFWTPGKKERFSKMSEKKKKKKGASQREVSIKKPPKKKTKGTPQK